MNCVTPASSHVAVLVDVRAKFCVQNAARQPNRQKDKHGNRDRQTDRQADRQTDRQNRTGEATTYLSRMRSWYTSMLIADTGRQYSPSLRQTYTWEYTRSVHHLWSTACQQSGSESSCLCMTAHRTSRCLFWLASSLVDACQRSGKLSC